MKKPFTLSLLIWMAIILNAQHNPDSLRAVWQDSSLPDTTRLKAVYTLADKVYGLNQLDSANHYARLQYDFAELAGHTYWVGRALQTQGKVLSYQGQFDVAGEYYSRSQEIFEKTFDPSGLADAINGRGIMCWKKGDLECAHEYFLKSLKILEDNDETKGMGGILMNLGQIYMDQFNYSRALEYFNRSVRLSREAGEDKNLLNALNSIGAIYMFQEEYALALQQFFEVLELSEEKGKFMNATMARSNIGAIYMAIGDHSKAIEYFNESLATVEKMGIKRAIAGISGNIGTSYFRMGDYELALQYHAKSLKISKEIGARSDICASLNIHGQVYFAQKQYGKALSYGNRALQLAEEIGNNKERGSAAEILYATHKATGNYRQALEMHELSIQMEDSVKSNENQKAVIQQEIQTEYEKQKALDDLENSTQLEIEREKRENQRLLSIAIGIGLLLVMILAIGLWNRNRFVKRTNTQLAAARDRAEQSEQYKEQFLANMSHEIRTPMHAISGMVKILERNEHPAAQKVYLDAMQKSSDNLLVLLNDILDLSKVEAGKLDIEVIPIEPAAIIKNVGQILQFKAEEKGLHLHQDIAPEVPKYVMGDPTRLNQILTNLVSNAIKFTEKGEVTISLIRKNDFLLYTVRDTGTGIPEDRLESIFDAFRQGERSTKRKYGGTGLGLNISRQLVELQGGNIWAESDGSTGSTFLVSLPLIPVQEESVAQTDISEAELRQMAAALAGSRILLAEDNEFNQMIAHDDLAFYIKEAHIEIAENGVVAVEKCKEGGYDVILMDVQMPEMDGYEAALRIREWEKAQGKAPIPILAMTASLLKSEINLAFEAGMNNYIPKPYQAEELIGRIYEEVKQAKTPLESSDL